MKRLSLATALLFSLLVTDSALAITRSWTGAVSSNWSTPGNWSPAGTPVNGDALTFDVIGAFLPSNNDLPAGTTLSGLTYGISVTSGGNALTVAGDITNNAFAFTLAMPLTAGAPMHIIRGGPHHGALEITGSFDVNGQTITVDGNVFRGPVFGTGAFVLTPAALFTGSGTFSGPITGSLQMRGTLPGASLTGSLDGDGTVGPVTISAGGNLNVTASPGSGPFPSSRLYTGPLSLAGGFTVGVNGDGTHSEVVTTGSVSLGGGALSVQIGSGAPAPGRNFIILYNDGSDPISGTFAGLPEGSQIVVGANTFTLSYHGGDGNDVSLTVTGLTKSWTGAVSGLWSNPQNWSPQSVPVAGDSLLFPSAISNPAMTNDLPPMPLGVLDIRCSNCSVAGNELDLGADLIANTISLTVTAPVKLVADVSIGNVPPDRIQLYGSVDMNGHRLRSGRVNLNGPLNGTGTLESQGTSVYGGGNFAGTVSGFVLLNGLPNAVINATGTMSGAVTGLTVPGNGLEIGIANSPSPFATLQTKALTLAGVVRFDLNAAGASDRIVVDGNSVIGAQIGATMTGAPALGQSFTVIETHGATSGTFDGHPEGSLLLTGAYTLRISYHGGSRQRRHAHERRPHHQGAGTELELDDVRPARPVHGHGHLGERHTHRNRPFLRRRHGARRRRASERHRHLDDDNARRWRALHHRHLPRRRLLCGR